MSDRIRTLGTRLYTRYGSITWVGWIHEVCAVHLCITSWFVCWPVLACQMALVLVKW